MIVLDFEQGTQEWLKARAGKVTASKIGDVMAKIKSGEAAARKDYRAQIVAEILTGNPQGSTFTNEEMRFTTIVRSSRNLQRCRRGALTKKQFCDRRSRPNGASEAAQILV